MIQYAKAFSCHALTVECSALEASLKTSEQTLWLTQICDPLTTDQMQKRVVPGSSRKFFAVPDALLDRVKNLRDLEDSMVFIRISKHLVGGCTISLGQLLPVVNEALERLYQITVRLKSGEVLFSEIDQLFGVLKKNITEIEKEIRILCKIAESTSWVDECLMKLTEYYKLDQYQRGAKIMQKLRKKFKLQENFDLLDQLEEAVSPNSYYAILKTY